MTNVICFATLVADWDHDDCTDDCKCKRLRKNADTQTRRHAVAIVVMVVGLGGALIAANIARDARDWLSGGLLLNIRETRLVVESAAMDISWARRCSFSHAAQTSSTCCSSSFG